MGKGRPATKTRTRRGASVLTAGDRLYVLALLGVLAVVGLMAVGPLQSFTAAADRVDDLTHQRDQLQTDVEALEERERRLNDPEELELLAREDLGLVRPGEIAFVVVPEDDDERPQIGPEGTEPSADDPLPWYRRVARALGELFE